MKTNIQIYLSDLDIQITQIYYFTCLFIQVWFEFIVYILVLGPLGVLFLS